MMTLEEKYKQAKRAIIILFVAILVMFVTTIVLALVNNRKAGQQMECFNQRKCIKSNFLNVECVDCESLNL